MPNGYTDSTWGMNTAQINPESHNLQSTSNLHEWQHANGHVSPNLFTDNSSPVEPNSHLLAADNGQVIPNTTHGIHNTVTNDGPSSSISTFSSQIDHEQMDELGPYEPELGQSENPHYYSSNEILYKAHVNRLNRTKSHHQL